MKKTIKHMILIAAGTVFLVLAGIYIEDAMFNRTFSSLDKNNIRFINSMWRQAEQGETCPLEELVPVKWDRAIAFPAYCSREKKTEAVGYDYDRDIRTGESEAILSMVFMDHGDVTFYVEFSAWQYTMRTDENGHITAAKARFNERQIGHIWCISPADQSPEKADYLEIRLADHPWVSFEARPEESILKVSIHS